MGGDIAKWITGINKLKEKRSLIPWAFRVAMGKAADNFVFTPMIRKAEVSND